MSSYWIRVTNERNRGVVICFFSASKMNSIDGAAAGGSNIWHMDLCLPQNISSTNTDSKSFSWCTIADSDPIETVSNMKTLYFIDISRKIKRKRDRKYMYNVIFEALSDISSFCFVHLSFTILLFIFDAYCAYKMLYCFIYILHRV
jgi:hypothetical protein